MIHQNILFIVSIAQSLGCILLEWNPATQKMHLIHNSSQKSKLNHKTGIHAGLLLIMILQGILALTKQAKSYSFTDQFVYGIGLVMVLAGHLELRVCRTHAVAICLYVNGIMLFQNKYHKILYNGSIVSMLTRPLSQIEKINVRFAYAYCLSALFVPVAFLYGLHWQNPCKPSLIVYWLIPECGNTNKWMWSICGKVIVLLINHWALSFSWHAAQFVLGGIHVICTLSLRGFIEM